MRAWNANETFKEAKSIFLSCSLFTVTLGNYRTQRQTLDYGTGRGRGSF